MLNKASIHPHLGHNQWSVEFTTGSIESAEDMQNKYGTPDYTDHNYHHVTLNWVFDNIKEAAEFKRAINNGENN